MKCALITGGSRGIGRAICIKMAAMGYYVLVNYKSNTTEAKKTLDLVKEKGGNGELIPFDVAEKERIKQTLGDWIEANEDKYIEVLVNNAGIQNWMDISDADFYQRAQLEVNTNILAPVHLTQLFIGLPSITTIMNVTSGLSFVPFTKAPVYSATKAFFHSFTLSSRYLLRNKNIEVVEIVPPALNTDLGGKGLHDHAPPVSGFIESIFEQLKEGKTQLTWGFSETMANSSQEDVKAAFARLNPA